MHLLDMFRRNAQPKLPKADLQEAKLRYEWEENRQRQSEQVVTWAKELIESKGNERYLSTLKTFLKNNPSGIERLSLQDQKKLKDIINKVKD